MFGDETRRPVSQTHVAPACSARTGHARAEFDQRPDVRARHAAVENVAKDRHSDRRCFPFFPGWCKIEQRLRGMLMRAVAGVDHARALRRPPGSGARPTELWRMTIMSAFNASRLRAVSLSVSPLRQA